MSFTSHAGKVRDPTLPHAHRVSALKSCVQLYHPLGFQETLEFLRTTAGRFERDENALLAALEVLEQSRAAWQAAVAEYAERRRAEKRAGSRVPREPNPYRPTRWYG
ncbi:hypothetical protein [Saccharothrix variisporea]|uniref:Uncharacterized protein n=1 Tax=Saccharothrix variisporea TaxID=543527 RepID=A0A495X6W3_9PSEU|nr:hypothetical protein [Saccharothrix variisporea]RKT68754.1 hypothetical protein DFJ66_1947 [Saccharothrix variisporea]